MLKSIAIAVLCIWSCAPVSPTPAPPPPPVPSGPTTPDCDAACAAATCARPAMTVALCASRCAEALKQLEGTTATCVAKQLMCSEACQ